jgi:hypothetical protein
MARRAAAAESLQFFAKTYLGQIFYLPWSADHERVIAKMERCARDGGLFAVAMPRGSGKTSIAIAAVLWALLFNLRSFCVLLAATDAKAEQLLNVIKSHLLKNDLLAEDFPEVCHAVRAMEGDARRCAGQLCGGQRTHIRWGAGMVVLPTIPGSSVSGHIIATAGLTSAIRGLIYTSPAGQIMRPDFCVPDDCQTFESANSVSQNDTREKLISGDVLGLSGPDQKLACIMPCTIISRDDLSARMLDRQRHPEWAGETMRLVYQWPASKRWEQYGIMRADSLRADGNGEAATAFYIANRIEMDQGSRVGWEARHNPDEVSAIQSAFNLKFRDPLTFEAEYQNSPPEGIKAAATLKPEDVIKRTNGLNRGTAPAETIKITAFTDVHDAALYWGVCGWAVDSTGAVSGSLLDYNTYPDQGKSYFTLREIVDSGKTLAGCAPGSGKEGSVYAGLQALAAQLFSRQYQREDGAILPIDKWLIDIGYLPKVVHQFIRSSGRAGIIMGSRGVGIGASSKPMSQYSRKQGEQLGDNWLIPKPTAIELRHVRFDSNAWKTWLHDRLSTPVADRGALTIFGIHPGDHRLLADHLCAEFPTPVEGQGRKLNEWRPLPNRDNHYLDVLVGNSVAASMCGVGNVMLPRRKPIRRTNREAQYF